MRIVLLCLLIIGVLPRHFTACLIRVVACVVSLFSLIELYKPHIKTLSKNYLSYKSILLYRTFLYTDKNENMNNNIKNKMKVLHSFFIRNQFIRNQGSAGQNFKKLEGSVWVDLRNFKI